MRQKDLIPYQFEINKNRSFPSKNTWIEIWIINTRDISVEMRKFSLSFTDSDVKVSWHHNQMNLITGVNNTDDQNGK